MVTICANVVVDRLLEAQPDLSFIYLFIIIDIPIDIKADDLIV